MRAIRTAATMAFDFGDEVEQKQAAKSWKQLATRFWVAGDVDEESPNKPKKLHRTKVLEWLFSTEQQLVIATGKGWGQFKVAAETDSRPDPSLWRSITVAIDQGGDGWSACHYLISENVNLWFLSDASHRTWNDAQLALQDCGLYHYALVTTIAMNIDHGPWGGGESGGMT